jgi:peptide deformylase
MAVSVREITIVGHRVLHQPTQPVGEVTAEVRRLVEDMVDTMEAADGVGLAANQVGVPLRLFVYDCPDDEGVAHRGHVLNPRLEVGPKPAGRPGEDDDEGCLSVPDEQFPTGRSDWARVTGTDLDGAPVELVGTGLFARCLQHESDHLDGLLYLDRLVGTTRRQAKRAVRDRGWGERRQLTWDPSAVKAEDV